MRFDEVQGDLEALWPPGLVDDTPVKPHEPAKMRVVDLRPGPNTSKKSFRQAVLGENA